MKLTLKSCLFAGLCAGALLSIANSASAADEKPASPPAGERGPGGPGGGRGRMAPAERIKAMAEELGLTQEQKDKILPILQANAEKLRAARELPEDQRRAEMQKLRAAEREQIAALLTPEQKEKFAKMAQRGPGGPGGPGGRREGSAGGPPAGEHKD